MTSAEDGRSPIVAVQYGGVACICGQGGRIQDPKMLPTSYANDPKDKARSTSEVSASAAAPTVKRNASARVQEPAAAARQTAAAFMGVPTSEDGRPLIELR